MPYFQEALKGNVLKSREKVRIMCTVGKVLSVMPYQFIMKYLDTILSPVFSELQDQMCAQKVRFFPMKMFYFNSECNFYFSEEIIVKRYIIHLNLCLLTTEYF